MEQPFAKANDEKRKIITIIFIDRKQSARVAPKLPVGMWNAIWIENIAQF
jgi:hypothetical protein